MLTPPNTSKRGEGGTFEATCSDSIYKDTRNRFQWKRPEGVCRTPPFPVARNRSPKLLDAFPPRETALQQILPPSRRTKAFFERFYRLPAAENRFSEIFSHFPPREGVFRKF